MVSLLWHGLTLLCDLYWCKWLWAESCKITQVAQKEAHCVQQDKSTVLLERKLFLLCQMQNAGEHVYGADVSLYAHNTKWINRTGTRITGCSACLLCFDCDVIWQPDSQNYSADFLSHLPQLFLPISDRMLTLNSRLSLLPVADPLSWKWISCLHQVSWSHSWTLVWNLDWSNGSGDIQGQRLFSWE